MNSFMFRFRDFGSGFDECGRNFWLQWKTGDGRCYLCSVHSLSHVHVLIADAPLVLKVTCWGQLFLEEMLRCSFSAARDPVLVVVSHALLGGCVAGSPCFFNTVPPCLPLLFRLQELWYIHSKVVWSGLSTVSICTSSGPQLRSRFVGETALPGFVCMRCSCDICCHAA